MTRAIYLFLLLNLLSHSPFVYAEGGCPPGMIPYSGTDISSCGPIPNFNQNQSPQPPPPQWASRWGAIATDSHAGIIGSSSDVSTSSEAQNSAIARCKKKGGINCLIEVTYTNQCAAMVLGDEKYTISRAPTIDDAIRLGTERCSTETKNCRVYYSACSLPERTQ